MSMNKSNMIDVMAKAAQITKKSAQTALDAFFDAITTTLKKNEPVTFVGFGTFKTRERSSRTGRNPQNGQTIQIDARTVPVFTPGKLLKDEVRKAKGGKGAKGKK